MGEGEFVKRHLIVAGATGEVGRRLVLLAAAKPDLIVHALVRRKRPWMLASDVHEIVFDYEDSNAYKSLFRDTPCDVLLIALGTTTAKSGADGLMRVDRDYPISLLGALEQACPHARVGFCSSVGADRPRGHYLKAKFDVEQRLLLSSLATVIARPSFLISTRLEFRPLENIGLPIFRALFGLLKTLMPNAQFVWKYAPIHVATVAERLLEETLRTNSPQHFFLEGKTLHTTTRV